jgi:hypothetical protein
VPSQAPPAAGRPQAPLWSNGRARSHLRRQALCRREAGRVASRDQRERVGRQPQVLPVAGAVTHHLAWRGGWFGGRLGGWMQALGSSGCPGATRAQRPPHVQEQQGERKREASDRVLYPSPQAASSNVDKVVE